jgi:hypothetical protein
MFDAATLARWVQPQHLTEDAVRGYRAAMDDHPAKMVVVRDFLTEEAAGHLAAFLADQAVFSVEHGLYSREGAVPAERWEAAPEEDRFFRFGKLSGQRPEAMLSDDMLTYLQWRSFVTEQPFHDLCQDIAGIPLGPSDDFGCHEFNVGDFLLAHDDANRDRRLAFVMYLTPGWSEACGGALHMTAADGTTDVTTADYNTIVFFDTLAGSTHRVGTIEPAAGELARRTFGGWFPNPS